jgi:hypothetical protein
MDMVVWWKDGTRTREIEPDFAEARNQPSRLHHMIGRKSPLIMIAG